MTAKVEIKNSHFLPSSFFFFFFHYYLYQSKHTTAETVEKTETIPLFTDD